MIASTACLVLGALAPTQSRIPRHEPARLLGEWSVAQLTDAQPPQAPPPAEELVERIKALHATLAAEAGQLVKHPWAGVYHRAHAQTGIKGRDTRDLVLAPSGAALVSIDGAGRVDVNHGPITEIGPRHLHVSWRLPLRRGRIDVEGFRLDAMHEEIMVLGARQKVALPKTQWVHFAAMLRFTNGRDMLVGPAPGRDGCRLCLAPMAKHRVDRCTHALAPDYVWGGYRTWTPMFRPCGNMSGPMISLEVPEGLRRFLRAGPIEGHVTRVNAMPASAVGRVRVELEIDVGGTSGLLPGMAVFISAPDGTPTEESMCRYAIVAQVHRSSATLQYVADAAETLPKVGWEAKDRW